MQKSKGFTLSASTGGDEFASGFFYGLMAGEEPQDAVNLGWAHGALLTSFPGDTTMATVEQVRAFAQSGQHVSSAELRPRKHLSDSGNKSLKRRTVEVPHAAS